MRLAVNPAEESPNAASHFSERTFYDTRQIKPAGMDQTRRFAAGPASTLMPP
jgi:hypothetical protein